MPSVPDAPQSPVGAGSTPPGKRDASVLARLLTWADCERRFPRRVLALGGLSVAVSLLLLAVLDLTVAPDTTRYVGGAEELLAGDLPSGKARSYLGYVAVVAVFEALGLGLIGVVVFQALAIGLAVVAAGHLARRLAGPAAGLGAAGLLAGNLDVHAWHTYVLPDSLYLTALVVMVAAADSARRRQTLMTYLAVAACLVLLATLRPNGLVAVPVVLAWLVGARLTKPYRTSVLGALVLVVATAVLAPTILRAADFEAPGEMLTNGVVIGGADGVQTPMPDAQDPETLADSLDYITDHPGSVARLVAMRVGYQVTHVRPYYPVPLNLARALIMLVLYLGAAVAVRRHATHPLPWLVLGLIAAHLAITAVTFADHEGRFTLHLVPLLSTLAGTAPVLYRATHQHHPGGDVRH